MLPATEALDRRARSIRLLKAAGVPILETLPVIEAAAEVTPRTAETVARRAIAIAIVALKGETGDQALVDRTIAEVGAAEDFTTEEATFLADPFPTEHRRVQFSWRYEALNVLMWAIRFVDRLEWPEATIDVPSIVAIIRDRGRAGLIANAHLRSIEELLDQADLIYRMHWAVRDAQLDGRDVPSNLEGDVVLERHYALNWLVGYLGQDWDDITTDT